MFAAYDEVAAALDEVEAALSTSRFLCGDKVTEADVRLFPTAGRRGVHVRHIRSFTRS